MQLINPNVLIKESVGNLIDARRQHSMLRHALDPDFLIADLTNKIEGDTYLKNQLANFPKQYVFVLGCLWIQKFYRDVNGRDYRQALKDLLGWTDGTYTDFVEPDSLFRRSWKIGRDNKIYVQSREQLFSDDFHAECWVLRANEAGGTSKLTKGMKFLLQTLRPEFTEGEFHAAIEQLENTAVASKGQIKAAELYEEDFIAVLRTLQTGDGEGWLTEFNEHPLRMAVAKCEWGLFENGGIRTIALRVVGRDQVSVGQDQVTYEKQAFRACAIFTWGELIKAGIDPKKQLVVSGIEVAPVNFKDVMLVRVSRKLLFHRFISPETEEIQAAELWALATSAELNAFTLGESTVITSPSRLTESLNLYLHKLDLRGQNRSTPIPLSFNGKPLLKVGAAPRLLPPKGKPEFQFHLDPETWLVFGEETELKLGDFFGDLPNPECWNNVQHRDGRIFLLKQAYGIATKASVLLPSRGYRLRVTVVFLPTEMRERMVSENPYNNDGISWEPQPQRDVLRPRVKGIGLCPGLLTVEGQDPVKVSVPSEKVHFWIREGLYTDLCYDTPLVGAEEILQKSLTVECYLPPGKNSVLWGNCDWFTTEEAGYCSFDLSDRPPTHADAKASLRVRTQSGEEFEFLSITESPKVEVKNKICSITFPQNFQAEDWDFCLVAEGTLGGQIGELVKTGCCADLEIESHENGDRRLLNVGRLHPDEGATLVLCGKGKYSLSENPQAFFTEYSNKKPTDDFPGPLSVQGSNPFRSRATFLKEKEKNSVPILIPTWISGEWCKQYNESSYESAYLDKLLNLDYIAAINAPSLEEIWLPASALIFHYGRFPQSRRLVGILLNRCFLEDLPKALKVQFSYGKNPAVQYQQGSEYLRIIWHLDDNVDTASGLPSWWDHDKIHDCPHIAHWISGVLSVDHLFSSLLSSDKVTSLVGSNENGNLAHLYRCLIGWMKISGYSKERRMIFQVAVLCRIHAWLGNDFGDERSKEILSVFVAQAWKDPATRKILTSDVLTVNWMLAWFHAPDFNADHNW